MAESNSKKVGRTAFYELEGGVGTQRGAPANWGFLRAPGNLKILALAFTGLLLRNLIKLP